MKIVPNHTATEMAGFEWDDEKYKHTLNKHFISFVDASELFEIDRRLTYLSPRPGNDGQRFVTVGLLKNRLFAVVYTLRASHIRMITVRRAHVREERIYRALHTG